MTRSSLASELAGLTLLWIMFMSYIPRKVDQFLNLGSITLTEKQQEFLNTWPFHPCTLTGGPSELHSYLEYTIFYK